jgi:hypothetical protein
MPHLLSLIPSLLSPWRSAPLPCSPPVRRRHCCPLHCAPLHCHLLPPLPRPRPCYHHEVMSSPLHRSPELTDFRLPVQHSPSFNAGTLHGFQITSYPHVPYLPSSTINPPHRAASTTSPGIVVFPLAMLSSTAINPPPPHVDEHPVGGP